MAYTFFKPVVLPLRFEMGASPAIIIEDPTWPELASKPIPAGADPGRTAVREMRKNLANERVRSVPLLESADPLDLADEQKVRRMLDVDGRVESFSGWIDAVDECDESVGEDLRRFSETASGWTKIDEDRGQQELLVKAVRQLARRHPPTYQVLRPTGGPGAVLDRARIAIDLGRSLGGDLSRSAATRSLQDMRQRVDTEFEADSRILSNEMLTRVASLAALSAFLKGAAGSLTQSWLIITRDVNELLSDPDELVERLTKVKGAPFLDVVFANPVYGGTHELHAFADKLAECRRASIFATIGDLFKESQAARFLELNPSRASWGAASLCLSAGSGSYRGFPIPAAPLIAGKRWALDDGGVSQMLNPHWGPQENKSLCAEAFDTLGWRESVVRALAFETGVNCVGEQSPGRYAPTYGRAPCKLTTASYIDTNRLGGVLSGNAVAWIDATMPGTVNAPEIQREWCRNAENAFFSPFAQTPGFHGEIHYEPTGKRGTIAVKLRLAMADPVERILFTYAQL